MAMFARHRKLVLAAILSAACCGAQAQEAKKQARTAAVADGVSSVVGIVAGVPLNPLLPVVGTVAKEAAFQHAESLPETERPRAYALAAASWQGSAAGNVCAAASVLSGGSFLPACLVVGVAWGMKTWDDSEPERRAAEKCAALRASTRKPKLRCPQPPRTVVAAAAPARSFITAQELVAP